MIRPDDDPLAWVMLLDQLSEAHTHLGELINEIERTSQIDDVDAVHSTLTMTCTEGREPSGLAVVESFASPR